MGKLVYMFFKTVMHAFFSSTLKFYRDHYAFLTALLSMDSFTILTAVFGATAFIESVILYEDATFLVTEAPLN